MASTDTANKHGRDELAGQRRAETAELHGELRAPTRHTLVTIAAAVSVWLLFVLPVVR